MSLLDMMFVEEAHLATMTYLILPWLQDVMVAEGVYIYIYITY